MAEREAAGGSPAPGFRRPEAPRDVDYLRCVRCGFCLSSCPTYRELGLEPDSPRGRIALIRAVGEGRLGLTARLVEHLDRCLVCRACETACPSGVPFARLMESARAEIRGAGRPFPRPLHPVSDPYQEREARLDADSSPMAPPSLARLGDRTKGDGGSGRPPIASGIGSTPTTPPSLRGKGDGGLGSLLRWLVFEQLFPHPGRLRLLAGGLRLYQRSGLAALARRSGLLRRLPGHLDELQAMLPEPPARFFSPPEVIPAEGQRRHRVALFAGCVMSTMLAPIDEATVRVLRRNGCEVIVPRGQLCCGALHVHSGERELARQMARRNIEAFERHEVEAIVVNAAGCGALLKEYGDLLESDDAYAERARRLAARVRDVSEFLAGIDLDRSFGEIRRTATYQDACHLAHAQQIRAQPRALLRAIPGLRLIELREPDRCCGSAGLYNVTQRDLAARILARKLDDIAATGAEILVTGNPGCHLQLQHGLRQRGVPMRVVHLVELLDEAYRSS